MVVSMSKHLMKRGEKGAKKNVVDLFSKKYWYDVKGPTMFNGRNTGENTSHRNSTQITYGGLKGRVFEVSLADL